MCKKRVDEIYNETTKFVNSLQEDVDKQGREWKATQDEIYEFQNERLNNLEEYNVSIEAWKNVVRIKGQNWRKRLKRIKKTSGY